MNAALTRTKKNIQHWMHSESIISNSLAILVGILTGLAIVVYDYALKTSEGFFFGSVHGHPPYYIILLPAIGGLIVGVLAHLTINTRRYDIEEVIEAIALRGGRISPKNAFLEVLASIITIGSGGSAGKGAPVVLAGSGIGSSLARLFGIRGDRVSVLLGCGAAGGIAASFNAPLAGVVFAVEVIIGELEAKTFIPIVLSAVFATLVSNTIFGVTIIQVSNYELVSPFYESFLYLFLGICSGIVAITLMRSLRVTRDLFDRLSISPMLKPAIGGLIVGIIGYFYPHIFGVGYAVIMDALANELTLTLMVALVFLKVIAFSLTIGSGGSGGSIIPALFVGAMFGGAYGALVNEAFPAITASSGAYALAGMGAVFAGTSHAPLAAILIIFELTGDYSLILPIMLACVMSNLVSSSQNPDSIFTEGLRRRGFNIRKGREVDIMESLVVKDAMRSGVQTISKSRNIKALITLMQSSRHAGFPVLDENGKLCGIVTLKDLRDKVKHDELDRKVSDIATKEVEIAYPDETLYAVLKRLAAKDIGRLPVVSRDDREELIGIITRSDIVKLYNKRIIDKVQQMKKEK